MSGEQPTPANNSLFKGIFAGRRVLLTGHTGFKGAWLALWLNALGAEVAGYALEPPTQPNLFDELKLADMIARHEIGDVRDAARLESVFAAFRPEIVFHLAAQSLVRRSYSEPQLTYETNVMGTLNLFEAVRGCDSVRVVVNVTSDKCYENREQDYAYHEDDPLGGYDPYSSSKGCAELLTAAYRSSFFGPEAAVSLASARAGNVVGGGDWAEDRLIPDCVRALSHGQTIAVRNPGAVRPWQFVLEPLAGYLFLAASMWQGGHRFDGPWNFGPDNNGEMPVRQVVETAVAAWGSGGWQGPDAGAVEPHEARLLKLDCAKAREFLGWQPVYEATTALAATMAWYKAFYAGDTDMVSVSQADIDEYVKWATGGRVAWTR